MHQKVCTGADHQHPPGDLLLQPYPRHRHKGNTCQTRAYFVLWQPTRAQEDFHTETWTGSPSSHRSILLGQICFVTSTWRRDRWDYPPTSPHHTKNPSVSREAYFVPIPLLFGLPRAPSKGTRFSLSAPKLHQRRDRIVQGGED